MLNPKRWVMAGLAAFCLVVGGNAQSDAVDLRALPKESTLPKPIKQEGPKYPYNLASAGLQGRVIVEFIINSQGVIVNPVVVKSNNPWFERPALDAVLKWKFKPATVYGKPVNVRVSQVLEFQLDSGGVDLWSTRKKTLSELPEEMRWDQPPVPVHTTYPLYPYDALLAKKGGSARVGFIIDKTGKPVQATILESTAPEFAAALLAMIDAWQFEPARKKDGTVVATPFALAFKFVPSARGEVPISENSLAIMTQLRFGNVKFASPKELDTPLKPLSQRPPVYPKILEAKGGEGEAVIEFFVDEQGDVQLPRVVSATAPEFGYAAAQAVNTWRFAPPEINKRAVTVRVKVPIGFSLKGDAAQ